jgi:2-phospho-L-lactate guanylyltransferase
MRDVFPRSAVVLPIRGFFGSKTRLENHLSDSGRALLMRAMASRVVRASHGLPLAVVTSAVEVEAWAKRLELAVLPDPGTLNAAASEGLQWARSSRFDRVAIVHADLPYVRTLCSVVDASFEDGLIAVSGNDDGGSPALSIPTTSSFEFSYGAGSLDRHFRYAVSTNLDVRLTHDPGLSRDLDTVHDLARLQRSRFQPDDTLAVCGGGPQRVSEDL